MQTLRRIALSAALAFGLFLSQGKVHGYAFNPWTTITGDKTFAINPFFYTTFGSNSTTYSMDMLFQTGLSSNVDIFVDVASLTFITGSASNGLNANDTFTGAWVMPRIDIGSGIVLGLNVGYTPLGGYLQPEFHGFWEGDRFAFEATVKYQFLFNAPATGTTTSLTMSPQLFLAPVLKIVKDILNFYIEIDPSFSIPTAKGSSFSGALNFVPGFWIALGGGSHQLSVAFTGIGLTYGSTTAFAVNPGVGLWYYTKWGLK